MDTPRIDEGALGGGDKFIHVRGKSRYHHLVYKLYNCVYETYWPKIGDLPQMDVQRVTF